MVQDRGTEGEQKGEISRLISILMAGSRSVYQIELYQTWKHEGLPTVPMVLPQDTNLTVLVSDGPAVEE